MRDRQHHQNDLTNDKLAKKASENADITPQSDVSADIVQRVLDTGDPSQLTPDMVLRLNQTHGNAFVQRLLNGKSPPNTNQWAKKPTAPSPNLWAHTPSPAVQRMPENTMDMIQRAPEDEELKTGAPAAAPGPTAGPAQEAKMPDAPPAPAPAEGKGLGPADEAKDMPLGTGAPAPMGTGALEEEYKGG